MIQTRDLCKASLNSSLSPFFIFSSSVGKKEKFNSHIVTCDQLVYYMQKIEIKSNHLSQPPRSKILQVPCKALYAMAILHCLEVFFHPEVKCRFYTFKVGCPVVWTEVAENYEENNSHFYAFKKNTLLSELCRFPNETCHKAHFFNKPFVSSFIRNNLLYILTIISPFMP